MKIEKNSINISINTNKFSIISIIFFSYKIIGMSNEESYDGNEQEVEEVELKEPEQPQKQEKIDRRKQQSKINMEKARLAKIEQLKQKKLQKQNTYEIDEETSSSDSDSDDSEVEYVLSKINKKQQKTKSKPKDDNYNDDRIKQLESMIMTLAGGMKKKKKAKKVKNKTIIHLPPVNQTQPQPVKKETVKSVELNQQTNKLKKAFNFDW